MDTSSSKVNNREQLKHLQVYTRRIHDQLEESQERENFNNAELKLLRDKLAIVVSAFETERSKLKENYERKCLEYDIKIADEEYARVATKMELDHTLRLKNMVETKLVSVGDDLEIAEKKNEEMTAHITDLNEVIHCQRLESNSLRIALENAHNLLKASIHAVAARNSHVKIMANADKNLSNVSKGVDKGFLKEYELLRVQRILEKKEEEIAVLKQCITEKDSLKVVLKTQAVELNDRVILEKKLANSYTDTLAQAQKSGVPKTQKSGVHEELLTIKAKTNLSVLISKRQSEGELGRRRRRRLLNHPVIQDDNNELM
jgi:hypothetical protein